MKLKDFSEEKELNIDNGNTPRLEKFKFVEFEVNFSTPKFRLGISQRRVVPEQK